jgi:histidine triad (HIT) family protein
LSDCLFCKICAGTIPAKIVAETPTALAFRDIAPQAPTHILVIPRKHVASMAEADAPLLGELMALTQKIAMDEKLDEGYRAIVNTGRNGGQTVFHLHVHLLGGRHMTWPPG